MTTVSKNPKFITLEGCEGAGKTTQITMLKNFCRDNNIEAVFTREPGGCRFAEDLRRLILDPINKIDALTELLLYGAARREHINSVILPALEDGKTVFCDRFTDSTLAYQGYGRGLDLKLIYSINTSVLGSLKINLTLFFDLSPEIGFKRKGGSDKSDRLDSEELCFHQKVYEGYKQIAQENERVITIDANRPSPRIFADVIKIITPF